MPINLNICIDSSKTIREAILKLDQGGHGVLFVIDDQMKLVGMITDGDVRRGLLKNIKLEDPLESIVNRHCKVAKSITARSKSINYAKRNLIRHLPVVDEDRKLVDLILLDEELNKRKSAEVFLMVGGLGSRLGSLTESMPKPMLPIKGKPILEHILNSLISEGFSKFNLCINYKGNIIKDYFRSGEQWGVDICYIEENERMGTVGGLSLIDRPITNPFILMNGDLLTAVNFQHFISFHQDNNADLTIGVKGYEVTIPFGVFDSDGLTIKGIQEKPTYVYNTNAGVYVMSPQCLKYLPQKKYFDMTDLIKQMIADGKKVIGFPIHEEWMDIGHVSDYLKAKE